MSIFALVYLGQKTDPVMASSIDTLSLAMLAIGVLGIGVTLAMTLKSKRAQRQTAESGTGRAQMHLAR